MGIVQCLGNRLHPFKSESKAMKLKAGDVLNGLVIKLC